MSNELKKYSIEWYINKGYTQLYIAKEEDGNYQDKIYAWRQRPVAVKGEGFQCRNSFGLGSMFLPWLPNDYPLLPGKCVKINLIEQQKRQK